MKQVEDARQLDVIAATVANFPGGIGISALHETLVAPLGGINRRTLQRRLARLVSDGRIVVEGRSVARLYRPVTFDELLSAWRVAEPGSVYEIYVPLSAEGAEVRGLVRQPSARPGTIGYDSRLLERYVPGASQYLPDPIRRQLFEIGRTPAAGLPAGVHARANLDRLRVDLSWASSRLEGNTYTRPETQNLLESARVPENRSIVETQMILNHGAAVDMLVDDTIDIGFDVLCFRNLHAVLSQNLLRDDASGRLRRQPVEIPGTSFAPAAMPQFIKERFHMLLDKTTAIVDPFEQAFFLMVQIPYLQPFVSVNKRVSRLAANIPLIRHNLCPLTFVDVPELAYVEGIIGVYELRRVELLRDVFIWAYERSCQRYLAAAPEPADPDPLKIRYQQELIDAVQTLVRGGLTPTPANVRHVAARIVSGRDRKAFARLLEDSIQNLDEGRLARYRLRKAEYLEWVGTRGRKK